MTDLRNEAIAAALSSDWKKAVEVNAAILHEDGNNVDCLNRLGRAHLELGDNKKAVLYFKKVLKIDKYDPIATRNLARALQAPVGKKNVRSKTTQFNFLEEPGKTKLVALVNLAPAKILLKQERADSINLSPRRHTVIVSDQEGNYLGSLPDDLGHRLSILIKGGNSYCALTKSVSTTSMIIFIRETVRAKKFADTPSFTANAGDYFSFVREDVAESGAVETEEEEGTISEKLHADEEPEGG